MTGLFILFSNIATGSIRAFLCLFLIFWLLSTKKPDKNRVTAVLAGIVAISVLCFAAGWSGFCCIVLETIWIAVCASYFQGMDTRMSMFISVFCEIAVSLWHFLMAAWLGVLFHSPTFLESGTGDSQIAVWLLHVLLIATSRYLWRNSNLPRKKVFHFVSIIVVFGFIAVISLSQQTILTIADDILDTWTILSVVLMMSVLIFNMNRQYEVEKELARLKTEQAELLERDYTALNHAYAINAKLFHDLHNHIGILRQFLTHTKLEEAIQYLDELQAPVQEMMDTVWTGDETVDYLINSKAVTAKESEIQYQAQVEFPRHTNLRSSDLCAILGNLLDNALEAARQGSEKEERFVRLTIRRINQMLVIKVENSFINPPVKEDGVLKTSKEKNGLHGWGLKSAQAAAQKYEGTVQTSYTNNIFRAVATLSYQGVPSKQ